MYRTELETSVAENLLCVTDLKKIGLTEAGVAAHMQSIKCDLATILIEMTLNLIVVNLFHTH